MASTKPDKRVDDDLEGEDELTQQERQKGVYQRQGTYREKALHRVLSPQRADPFSSETPAADLTTYSDVAQQATLQKERAEVLRQIQTQKKEGENGVGVKRKDEGKDEDSKKEEVKKRRSGFDIKEPDDRWETPVAGSGEWGETPAVGAFGGGEPAT
ncbi:Splicing factor 3B subunit 1, partial [Perkinsus olseni]